MPGMSVRPPAIMLGALLAATTLVAAAPVAEPLVSVGPKVGEMWNESPLDEAKIGFTEEEYMFEGTTSGGVPYKSRMIVRRPLDARRFNGTVIVEWMNASSGNDMDIDYMSVLPLMQQQGYAYVAVSVQANVIGFLQKRNPARYGTLNFKDDQAQNGAFDIFSQAGQALKGRFRGVDPMGGLKAKYLIAIGQSQSSGRLTTFVNNVHGARLAPVYDAALLHAGGGAPSNFPIPVLKLNSENEAPGYFRQRGVTNRNYQYWEVPGTAHQPLGGTEYSLAQLSAARSGSGGFPRCQFPYQGEGGPVPMDALVRSGIFYLDRQARTGKPIPPAPLIDMVAAPPPPPAPPPAAGAPAPGAGGRGGGAPGGIIQRDGYGNAKGGIRMPQLEVPTGRSTTSTACRATIGGQTTVLGTYPQFDAFDGGKDPVVDPADMVNATEPASPKALYKNHGTYVRRFNAATDFVLKQGLILKFDADAMKKEAAASNIAK